MFLLGINSQHNRFMYSLGSITRHTCAVVSPARRLHGPPNSAPQFSISTPFRFSIVPVFFAASASGVRVGLSVALAVIVIAAVALSVAYLHRKDERDEETLTFLVVGLFSS